MKNEYQLRVSGGILRLGFFFSFLSAGYAATPWLHADGNVIKDPAGSVVVLRGISMIDVGGTEKHFGGAIKLIDRITNKNDTSGNSPGWYPKVIRIPIYPSDEKDYDSPWTFEPGSDDFYENLLRPVVDYCKSKDMYAIVDWHYIGNTFDYAEQTSRFWEYMAPKFAEDSHVLYELFNEPTNKVGTDEECWLSVRKDMQTWIDTIRKSAPKNLLLVAGASYAQIIGPAADNPVSDPVGGNNFAFVSHLYPLHWLNENADWYKNNVEQCVAVYPVFLSEWGFSRTFRHGRANRATIENYAEPLLDWAEKHKMCWTCWAASYDWFPVMFNTDWTLRCGDYEMGCFLKDRLYEMRNADQPAEAPDTAVKPAVEKTEGKPL